MPNNNKPRPNRSQSTGLDIAKLMESLQDINIVKLLAGDDVLAKSIAVVKLAKQQNMTPEQFVNNLKPVINLMSEIGLQSKVLSKVIDSI